MCHNKRFKAPDTRSMTAFPWKRTGKNDSRFKVFCNTRWYTNSKKLQESKKKQKKL